MTRPVVLILGVSSGFGAAAARAYAHAGYDILGVHLDRRATMPAVKALQTELEGIGTFQRFYNANAADDGQRAEMVADMAGILSDRGGAINVLLHSLAFGTLKPFVTQTGSGATRKQVEMTIDVMANSLVYWVQDLVGAELLANGGRVFALTSSGSHTAWADYGPVSAAKAALEAHIRQLCLELAPRAITVNALMPGVTRTPALDKIPGSDVLEAKAISKSPYNRLTTPEDVAECLVALSAPGTYWMNGNVVRVDGGEDFCA